MFQNKYPIAYEVASDKNTDVGSNDVVPILLLNGFGVGSFHQHRLMQQLLSEHKRQREAQHRQHGNKPQKQYVVYAIDYLGQGKSWPAHCNDGNSEDELNLCYSADTWIDQLVGFIKEVIISSSKENKVHVVGNSVGGYLSTILSFYHPQVISSLTLLNATPVWGLNLPFWNGKLPAPPIPKIVGRLLFDVIRDLDVIDKYLDAAYVHRAAFDGSFDGGVTLGNKIRACTEGQGGHAAFASILWSPPASDRAPNKSNYTLTSIGFYDALEQLPIDVLLIFGSDDSWCNPAIAKRMHSTLARRRTAYSAKTDYDAPAQRYIALKNVGHCPNHEAPTAVSRVLLSWLDASSNTPHSASPMESECASTLTLVQHQRRNTVPLVPIASCSSKNGNIAKIKEPWGDIVISEVSIEESERLNWIDWIVSSVVG